MMSAVTVVVIVFSEWTDWSWCRLRDTRRR